jgi:putative membrane protein
MAERVDLEFLLPLFAGIGLAFVTLSYAMVFLLDVMAAPTYAFFFVVILGSSLVLFKSEKLASLKNLAIAILGFIIAFYLVGLNPANLGHSLPLLFITGILVIVAMILPGISGALVLLYLNQYEYFFDALHEFRIIELAAFATGAILGILAFSHVLDALLKRHRAATVAFLIGLTLGALRLCYANIVVDSNTIFPVLLAILVGLFVMFMLEAGKIFPKKRARKAGRARN